MTGHLLLIGGAAGGGVDEDVVAAVEAVLDDAGPTERRLCDATADLPATLRRADGRTVVVAGGDGTLHVVVGALDALGLLPATPIALVPLGTGNDLARGLGLPLDPVAAARRVVAGRAQPLDLVRVDGEVVVNASHAGIGVAAAERAADLKGAVGPVAYPMGAVVAGAEADALDIRVTVDGAQLAEGPLLLVGVGNGSSVGGGTVLFPSADPADGLLEVVTVRDRGAWDRLRLGLAARKGEHARLDGVRTARGREVVVEGAAAWNDDGEVGTTIAGRTLRVDPGAWLLVR